MVVIGVTQGKYMFLLDGYCHKMEMSDKWTALLTLYERWKTAPGVQSVEVAYETYGSGAADIQYFKSKMNEGIQPTSFLITELERTNKGQESKRSRHRAAWSQTSRHVASSFPSW